MLQNTPIEVRRGSWLHCSCGTWLPLRDAVLVPVPHVASGPTSRTYRCSTDCVPRPDLFGREPLPVRP